jgi:thioredoxin reductase
VTLQRAFPKNGRIMSESSTIDAEVVIVGGGPAGLAAAITLGRARRRVVLLDHGRPRNGAAHHVHCYLGLDGVAPEDLRARGRKEAMHYGVEFRDAEVLDATCASESPPTRFVIRTASQELTCRAVLLATGVVDELPDVSGLREFYGRSVHHCPYCDGWEHRDQRLATIGHSHSAVQSALGLLSWSASVTVCSNGRAASDDDVLSLERHGVALRVQKISQLVGVAGVLQAIEFVDGERLACDAAFFSSEQGQQSQLPRILGCEYDGDGHVLTAKQQGTRTPGLFLAGDADGDSQFAIVAAAEGVTAAVAIDKALKEEDLLSNRGVSRSSSSPRPGSKLATQANDFSPG